MAVKWALCEPRKAVDVFVYFEGKEGMLESMLTTPARQSQSSQPNPMRAINRAQIRNATQRIVMVMNKMETPMIIGCLVASRQVELFVVMILLVESRGQGVGWKNTTNIGGNTVKVILKPRNMAMVEEFQVHISWPEDHSV